MELTGGNCHKNDLAIIDYRAHNSSKPSASGKRPFSGKTEEERHVSHKLSWVAAS